MALSLAAINAGVAVRHSRAGVARARRRLRGDVSCGTPETEFDPLDPLVVLDPYPWYRRLHQSAPIHHNRRRALWIISGYEEVRAAARDHEALSSAESVTRYRARLPMMLTVDRPEHTRLRKLVARDFTRQALEERRPEIERLADEALGGLLERGGGDWVAGIAAPLPVAVIAGLLGVPASDLSDFRRWSDQVVEGFAVEPGPGSVRLSARVLGATIKLRAYFSHRAGDSPSGLLGALLAGSDDGRLSADEVFWFALMLLVAGNETTTNLLGTLLIALAGHPEQYAKLRARPDLAAGAVEEALRHVSPIQGLYRTAAHDYRIGSATIPAGGRVLLLFGAANRDPRRYPDPDAFDVERDAADHVAFGSGIHFCLGAHLARLEAAVVLRSLCERVAEIELAGEPIWNNNASVRGLTKLPLRLVAA